jgi:hypothetical protein
MTLLQQHLEAINKLIEWDESGSASVDIESAATACEGITIEHMGKILEWASRESWRQIKPGFWICALNPTPWTTTPELIALYFESINPKT